MQEKARWGVPYSGIFKALCAKLRALAAFYGLQYHGSAGDKQNAVSVPGMQYLPKTLKAGQVRYLRVKQTEFYLQRKNRKPASAWSAAAKPDQEENDGCIKYYCPNL